MKEKIKLPDKELIEKVKKWARDLDFNHEPDALVIELCNRVESYIAGSKEQPEARQKTTDEICDWLIEYLDNNLRDLSFGQVITTIRDWQESSPT